MMELCNLWQTALTFCFFFLYRKRRRQQFCRRRLRLGVNHALFGRRLSLSAVDGRCAGAGNNEQCDPKNHHAAVAGLGCLGLGHGFVAHGEAHAVGICLADFAASDLLNSDFQIQGIILEERFNAPLLGSIGPALCGALPHASSLLAPS